MSREEELLSKALEMIVENLWLVEDFLWYLSEFDIELDRFRKRDLEEIEKVLNKIKGNIDKIKKKKEVGV